MAQEPPARLLDISRLISRAGRTATGVDRVECAYLAHLARREAPLFLLSRLPGGHVLIAPPECDALAARLSGAIPWGAPDLAALLRPRRPRLMRRAESDLRRLAHARCGRGGLAAMLRRHLPAGSHYFNVGHVNLTHDVFGALSQAGMPAAVMIHDAIPLDFPQYQREGTPARFAAMLDRVRRHAGCVIYNSRHSRERAEFHMSHQGTPPPGLVAPLGIDPAVPDPRALPAGLPPSRPYFVALGTIEPRKGHGLLLDVWDRLAADLPAPPMLLICGNRGWNNHDVFARLDRLGADAPVRELAGLSDGAVAALLGGARALLCPSRAEGFGLPAVEAAAMGTRIVCTDLPARREVLGALPVYLPAEDCYQWRDAVIRLTEDRGAAPECFPAPAWDDHFGLVLSCFCGGTEVSAW
ncbi:glycosyltransferase family 4 protein [Pontibaca methylaminivorans]|uniref:Glycosyl transferases group 1 n=1 Tax=Pontibaca methylaminivorans TaxID=515897 RepID=A0A1R3X3H4_9RHOB|nr:glycosyltransferase family 1 protein [Pontibaca methylaminivorans]SIT85316.1 Glycosyl transferases group 1 [Pontibaca methylaminivorans]